MLEIGARVFVPSWYAGHITQGEKFVRQPAVVAAHLAPSTPTTAARVRIRFCAPVPVGDEMYVDAIEISEHLLHRIP